MLECEDGTFIKSDAAVRREHHNSSDVKVHAIDPVHQGRSQTTTTDGAGLVPQRSQDQGEDQNQNAAGSPDSPKSPVTLDNEPIAVPAIVWFINYLN